ncbi:amine dehydrogenase large subunit [Acetobacter oeni]|uniref:Methylamine dehydrogenase heavy chain n=1 Tax=Acetobacter oeni TaxID=304077 RepID=A0A511XM74_9PROT|nr:amine dehydrogenase large subunit [Acetobacter oeni]MBB3884044.1 methylamine dehydrogenase heavy chain [Acetobacter oeni]GBR08471.1 hypothetical protein AA21952_2628 [Acetobacter oeni LMG 21952]GEN64031.1 hypothetical protein AOE01nite_22550 [Acetobacter oeni]
MRVPARKTVGLLAVCAALSSGAVSYAARAEEVTAETEYTEKLPVMGAHWTLVATDNNAYTLYDGDKGKILGTVPADFEANLAVSSDRHTYYVATTMWTRGDHGDREDFLQAYDARTLDLTKEIAIPARALSVFKQQSLGLSNDGHWAYVFDMTPTTRVSVVDLHSGKVATDIDIPGCALEFPWAKGGFSSLCGDGSLTNVAYDGGTPKITHSHPFFDANEAPVFEQSPSDTKNGIAYFITYDGKVFETKLGPDAQPAASWGLTEAAGMKPAGRGVQEMTWRPGGSEPFAFNAAQHRLYVLMHVGNYWTHKDPAKQVWVFDTQAHKLVNRIDLPEVARAISVSQDASPQIYAVSGSNHDAGKLIVVDTVTGKVLHSLEAGARPMSVVAGM